MELRLILRSLAKRWWIFLTVFLITAGATLFLTMQQTPIYRAKATYITRLSSEITDAKLVSTALDTLNRYAEFQGTYSEIAMSQKIKRAAAEKIGINGSVLRGLSVSSRALPGSKILEISVEGANPQLARDFATAVGEETIAYANAVFPSYDLELLDPSSAPATPISPKLPFNLVLGIIMGSFFGLMATVLASWLRGDFKGATIQPASEEDFGTLVPLREELELLLHQCELIRAELNETREVIYNTESQARTIRTMLNSFSENGNSYERGKRKVMHKEDQDEAGNLESKSPNQ